ncbi:hypothetical protein [Terrabacter sp. C0L_2]|uniref:hypothetical protein n=1 Tax=Terrabacter sp. C0L_2 TaxID=3108389 RepID=UPI002ED124F7|nr:hypothetical protein U5C87_17895 [Terrabacter sp. C0L_2]
MSKPSIWGREPALILGALQAVIALAISFGLDLSPEQTGAILAASAAVLAVVTRSQVSPSATVAAETAPSSSTGLVAGPAADVPEGEPVDVVAEGSLGDGLGDAVEGITDGILPKPGDDQPKPQGGYWGGV